MKIKKGLFITFEGPEASGKSSQILLLKNYFVKNKIPFKITREPGGTKVAEKLRKIILDNKSSITNAEEILLLMSARLNHINNIILPNLKQGKIVISDRYVDSTFVYQGFVNKFGISNLKKLHSILLNNFLPKYTFVFILEPKEIIKRLNEKKIKNKYDKNKISFHKSVIEGYNKISKSNKRYIKIDASQNKQSIHLSILKKLGFK